MQPLVATTGLPWTDRVQRPVPAFIGYGLAFAAARKRERRLGVRRQSRTSAEEHVEPGLIALERIRLRQNIRPLAVYGLQRLEDREVMFHLRLEALEHARGELVIGARLTVLPD